MKIKLKELKRIIKEEIDKSKSLFVSSDDITHEDIIPAGNSNKYTSDPEETLINKLFAAKKLRDRYRGTASTDIAKELGLDSDEETLAMIDDLMKSEFYKEH